MKTLSEIISILSESKLSPSVHKTYRDALNDYDKTEGRAAPARRNPKRRSQYAYGRVEAKHGEDAADTLRAFHDEQGETN